MSDTTSKSKDFFEIFRIKAFGLNSVYWRSKRTKIYNNYCKPSLTLTLLIIYQCHLVIEVMCRGYDKQIFKGGTLVAQNAKVSGENAYNCVKMINPIGDEDNDNVTTTALTQVSELGFHPDISLGNFSEFTKAFCINRGVKELANTPVKKVVHKIF